MHPDDQVCLCFRVSKRKIVNFCRRERPPVASLISECLSAGTGCGWCVPYLKRLHEQVQQGVEDPDLPVNPEEYAKKRLRYRQTGERPPEAEPDEGSREAGKGGERDGEGDASEGVTGS